MWVIKEKGGVGRGVSAWVCESHRDRDGDKCLSAFG